VEHNARARGDAAYGATGPRSVNLKYPKITSESDTFYVKIECSFELSDIMKGFV